MLTRLMLSPCTHGRSSQHENAELQAMEQGSDLQSVSSTLSSVMLLAPMGLPVLSRDKSEICGSSVHRLEEVLK